MWRHLARSQLGAKFSRQMPVDPHFADFLCRELMLVIECDGVSHDREPAKDTARDHWLRDNGYSVLHFANADVLGNIEGVVTTIHIEVEQLQSLPPAGGKRDFGSPSEP